MTDLSKLKVSLTKHNAHKVAQLLKTYDSAEVFARLGEVNAEMAQARKNLSTGTGDILPQVWGKVQNLGPQAIDALVLLGIIFSHHSLILAMSNASPRQGLSRTIARDADLVGKEYTNFARILDQLGFVTRQEYDGVTFDLTSLFQIPGLGPLFAELLGLKLRSVGWAGNNSLAQEAVALGLQDVFGIEPSEFQAWLELGAHPSVAETGLSAKDQNFFQQQSEGPPPKNFAFIPGHKEKDANPITKIGSPRSTANQLHNDIQNRLYLWLKGQHGAENVGTEIDTGSGTSIDAAVRSGDHMTFYEIKTTASVRTNIRQALPQLLEYAHWIDDCRADSFVVVSHLPITESAGRYLAFLRKKYGIPISYQQYDLTKDRLI